MIKKLNKIYKWFKIVERNESVLMIDYLIRGVPSANTKRVLGLEKGFERYLFLDKLVYWDAEEAQQVADYLNNIIKEKGFAYLRKLIRKWVEIGEVLLLLAEKLRKDDNDKKTNQQLIADFSQFSKQNWMLSTSALIPLAIEKKLSDKIDTLLIKKGLSEDKKREYFMTLVFPKKESNSTEELICFYSLVSLLQGALARKKWRKNNIRQALSEKEVKKKFKQYLDNFNWIGARWYIGKGWNEEDIVDRISKQDPLENYKEKVKELEGLVSKNRKETARIIKELKLSSTETDLIETAKEYVFIRTYRTDTFNKAGFRARPFLEEIAKRLGLSFEGLIFLTTEEIIDGLKNGMTRSLYSKIKERQKAFGVLFYNRQLFIFEGEDIKDFRRSQEIKEDVKTGPVDVLKGMVASPGKVRSVVKVIKDKKELDKIKRGDILVTSMTTPDFVPAMERAVAIVTNEGGITCHAAIVSREMKKPCIIGTKIATKVLKDGDLVEVDANKGIVKIIKRKNA